MTAEKKIYNFASPAVVELLKALEAVTDTLDAYATAVTGAALQGNATVLNNLAAHGVSQQAIRNIHRARAAIAKARGE